MRHLIYPDSISAPLKVVDVDNSEEIKLTLDANLNAEFADRIEDTNKILNTDVVLSTLGIQLKDCKVQKESGRLNVLATVINRSKNIDKEKLSQIIKPDTLVAELVLIDPEQKLTGDKLKETINDIYALYKKYPELKNLLRKNGTYDLSSLREYAIIREEVSNSDINKFIFGALRLEASLDSITERVRLAQDCNNKIFNADNSIILSAQGFAHPEAFGVFKTTDNIETGSEIIFPRTSVDELRFLINLLIKNQSTFEDFQVPVEFYSTERKKIHPVISVEKTSEQLEKKNKTNRALNSYPISMSVFSAMSGGPGTRKAVFIRDQKDLGRLLRGDHSAVEGYKKLSVEHETGIDLLASDPSYELTQKGEDPMSYPELRLLEKNEGRGVLFCKYFPSKHVLDSLKRHNPKLEAIVFQAPSFSRAESIENPSHPLEEHIFFDSGKFVALTEFHEQHPDIKIVWAHPGVERNLVFVDDGSLPMFAKPEVEEYMEDKISLPESASEIEKFNKRKTFRVSFCGSSTANPDMSAEEKEEIEKSYTQMYNDFFSEKGKKLVGVNGGGPDVMDRNGKHLQEMNAISVASACDLGKAGQSRHTNWDAVLNQKGDEKSFALREMVLMSGDLIHIAPGGLGTIQEIIGGLVGNKTEMTHKPILMVGSEYWEYIRKQLIVSAKDRKIKSKHLKFLFTINSPEEGRVILEKLYSEGREEFLESKIQEWEEIINS